MLNGLDLFSGIGGISRALAPWVRPVAYCEVDRYCQGVLLSRQADGSLPRAPIWDDVRTLRGDFLPRVDIIYGGFPCQDLSVAGNGAGLAGERSGLYWELLRLVREVAPRFVFLENVPAIRTRGLRQVVGSLAGLGYDCRWACLSAFDVGAPHKRERWFLLAHRNCDGCEGKSERDSAEQAGAGPRGDDPDFVPDSSGDVVRIQSGRLGGSGGIDSALAGINGKNRGVAGPTGYSVTKSVSVVPAWSTEPDVGRVADGVPKRVDRLRALGNAVVPAQAHEAFVRLMGLQHDTEPNEHSTTRESQ